MLVKADLHNHVATFNRTIRRYDFNQIVGKIRENLGAGGVLGLVNFSDRRYEIVLEKADGYERVDIGNAFYVPEKDVLVVKGQEVSTQQGHLLVLGIPKNIHLNDNRTLEDTIKEAKDNNGMVILDHPYGFGGIMDESGNPPDLINSGLIKQIDGIETHNGLQSKRALANMKAAMLWVGLSYQHHFNHLSPIVSSDGHSLYEIGSSYMKISAPDRTNSQTLISSLKEGIKVSELSEHQKHHSLFGFLDHTLDMALYLGLLRLGIDIDKNHR